MRKDAAGNTTVRLLSQVMPGLAEARLGNWTEHAICTQTDPEIFFPPKGNPGKQAKAICAHCPVRAECLAYAITADEKFGIWGGLNRTERQRISAKPRHANAASRTASRGAA
jgi:WhiB family redox-sensing transcriptional regulator